MVELILWDIDGTLLRGGGVGRAATRLAMQAVYSTTAGVDMHRFGGKTDWFTLQELLGRQGISAATVEARLPAYATSLAVHMAALMPKHNVRLLPAVNETFDALAAREGLLHGIVTGNVRTTAPLKLRAVGLDPKTFVAGAYGDEARDRNDLPPLAIERASTVKGATIDPAQVLVVGDTLADIACARAVGAQVCAVLTGFEDRAALEAAEPDYLLDDLSTFMTTVQLD